MENKAAFLYAPGTALKVEDAPVKTPGPYEILIRNHAVAINPVDYRQQDTGMMIQSYPYITGMDVAGTVVEIGDSVATFKKGDRVAAVALALIFQDTAYSGFQNYTLAPIFMASKIPDHIAFTDAVVLPLTLGTATRNLFEKSHLDIEAPSVSVAPSESNKEKVILVWGGSGGVGSSAIQLLAAGGYTILTTASPKNFDYVKDLGATEVFDHSDPDVVAKLVSAARGKQVLGVYDTIGAESTARAGIEYLHALGGGKYTNTHYGANAGDIPQGVEVVGQAHAPMQGDDGGLLLWAKVWGDFIGKGLEIGKLKAKPDAFVLKGGLEKIDEGVDMVRKGVSATKVVVQIVE